MIEHLPRDIRPGTASTSNQNCSQDNVTINDEGIYTVSIEWIMRRSKINSTSNREYFSLSQSTSSRLDFPTLISNNDGVNSIFLMMLLFPERSNRYGFGESGSDSQRKSTRCIGSVTEILKKNESYFSQKRDQ